MGLFSRKKKEIEDPVGVKCHCNNGVETITTYETIRNPEPRPRFYPWMNNPGSEEYAQGGDRDARAFANYEPSKTVASGSYTRPCTTCNGTGIRIMERDKAKKEDRTIVYYYPKPDQNGAFDLSSQRRDSEPTPKPPEQKPERQDEQVHPKAAAILVKSPNFAEIKLLKDEGDRIIKAILKTNLENYDSAIAELKKAESALNGKVLLVIPKTTDQELNELTSLMVRIDFAFTMCSELLGKDEVRKD